MHVKANECSFEISSRNPEIGIIQEPREFRSKMPFFSEPEHYQVLLFKIKLKKCSKSDALMYAWNSNTQETEAGGSNIWD